uniref:Uncharacterized protein n=1 Tax=Anopheles coluzzii TaxID=1518534 RepID=A0A8W7Q518_ANOCL
MSSKSTFFYELARKSENEIQATLMRCPSHITERDESERLLIHWAALVGQERLVESILERHPDQLNAEDDAGLTPLILATLGRHPAIVTMLTFRGANVHQRSRRGHSALQYACSKNQPAIARHLVQLGANVDVVDYLNETPLHRATAIGSTELMGDADRGGRQPEHTEQRGQHAPAHGLRGGQSRSVRSSWCGAAPTWSCRTGTKRRRSTWRPARCARCCPRRSQVGARRVRVRGQMAVLDLRALRYELASARVPHAHPIMSVCVFFFKYSTSEDCEVICCCQRVEAASEHHPNSELKFLLELTRLEIKIKTHPRVYCRLG